MPWPEVSPPPLMLPLKQLTYHHGVDENNWEQLRLPSESLSASNAENCFPLLTTNNPGPAPIPIFEISIASIGDKKSILKLELLSSWNDISARSLMAFP